MVVHSFGVNENKGIEKSNTIFEKAKKPVKVTRDGKTFIQMREEGKKDVNEHFVTYSPREYVALDEQANGEQDPNKELILKYASKIDVGDVNTIKVFNEKGKHITVEYGGAGLDDKEHTKIADFLKKSTAQGKYIEAKTQIFEYLENHDVKAGDVTVDMIDDANEIMELGLSGSEIERLAKQYRQQKITDVFTSVQEKLDDEYDKAHEKKDKYESLKLGVKNLKSNLQSQLEKLNADSSGYEPGGYMGNITAGRIEATKRAIELLNDGLSHLL